MPADRFGDLGRQVEAFETRMGTLVAALTGKRRGSGDDGGDRQQSGVSSSEYEGDVEADSPTGASQAAVEAAVRRVEEREGEVDERAVA